MKRRISWKSAGLGLAMMASSIVVPTPASATIEEYRECLHNCYIAYFFQTYQPGMYQLCAYDCRQYDN